MLPVLLLLTLGRPTLVKGDLAQTAATCISEYAWMGTSKGVSPCQVAASLNALCNNGSTPILLASRFEMSTEVPDRLESPCIELHSTLQQSDHDGRLSDFVYLVNI